MVVGHPLDEVQLVASTVEVVVVQIQFDRRVVLFQLINEIPLQKSNVVVGEVDEP